MTALSILVPCLSSSDWRPLKDELERQAGARRGAVEVCVLEDGGEKTSGQKRAELMAGSTGRYVAFVEDVDRVAENYVDELLHGISQQADVVTFDVTVPGQHWSLHRGQDDRYRGLMCANHLCAWRRDLAQLVAWHPQLGYADDQLWYKPLALVGAARTEWHVDQALYHRDSGRRACDAAVRRTLDIVGSRVDVYMQGRDVYLQHGYSDTFGSVVLRDRHNHVCVLDCRAVNRVGSVRIWT